MSEPTAILQVLKLCSGYGRSQVLFDLSLRAPARGAVAVLGRNGVGKTTLLKTLVGEIRPMGGSIHLEGRDATAEPPEQRVRRGLGYVPQEQAIFSKLTVRENLALGAIRQADKSGIEQILNFFPKLAQRLGQTAGTLSGGERKMLAIGRALLGRPKVLLLDEPTEGVWAGVIEEIAQRLRRLTQEISLILVEQHIELALDIADYAYVIDRGQVALEGPSRDIRKDPRLLRFLSP